MGKFKRIVEIVNKEAEKFNIEVTVDVNKWYKEIGTFSCKDENGIALELRIAGSDCCIETALRSEVHPIPYSLLYIADYLLETYALNNGGCAISILNGNRYTEEDKINLRNLNFKLMPEKPLTEWDFMADFKESEMEWRSIWAKEVREGIIKDFNEYILMFEKIYKKMKKEDVTCTYNSEISNNYFETIFYYKGETSELRLTPSKDKMEFTGEVDTENSVEKYSVTSRITCREDIEEALKEYFEEAKNRRKMINLLQAPRKHYDEYFKRLEFKDILYDTLLEIFEAEKIEEIAAKKDVSYIRKHNLALMRFENYYILIDGKEINKVYSPKEKEKAVETYKSTQLKRFQISINNSLKRLKILS